MKINLISDKKEKVTFNLAFPYIHNRYKVKKLIAEGYSLAGEEDAVIALKLKLY